MPITGAAAGWMQAAMGASSGPVAMGLQRLGVNYDHRKQREQQQKLMDMQISGESRLMDIQNQKQLEMWEKTGYGAQKDQMLRAGLNPALMYGMGGGGGQTVGGGMPSANAGTASDPNTRSAITGMGIQNAAMMAAQIENLKANTEKTKVEAEKTAGVDTAKVTTEIKSLTQGIDNQKAQEELTKTQNRLQTIETAYKTETYEDAADTIKYEARKAEQEVRSATANANVDEATVNDKIKIVHQQAIGAILANNLLRSQNQNVQADTKLKGKQGEMIDSNIEMNINQMNKMAADIQQGWEKLSQSEKIMKVDALMKEVEQMYQGPMKYIRVHDPATIAAQIDIIMGLKREDFRKIK